MGYKSLPLKLMSIESTPPPTPLISRHLLDPINNTTMSFQNMTIKTPSKTTDWLFNSSPCITNYTPKLTPTSIDRYLIEHCRVSDSIYKSTTAQSISVQHTEVTNGMYSDFRVNKTLRCKSIIETSRLYSYMNPIDGVSFNSWSNFDDRQSVPSKPSPCSNNSLFPQRINSNSQGLYNSSPQYQSQEPWFLSDILRQNTNISLSTTAQQILAGNSMNNNRPLRSEKIDNDVIKHLIQEANWKRQCGMKKEV